MSESRGLPKHKQMLADYLLESYPYFCYSRLILVYQKQFPELQMVQKVYSPFPYDLYHERADKPQYEEMFV